MVLSIIRVSSRARGPAFRTRVEDLRSLQHAPVAPRLLRLHVALSHALQARIAMGSEPRATCCVIQQLAMTGWQILALAGETYSQDPVPLLTQREAHRIGITLGGQPAAAFSRNPGCSPTFRSSSLGRAPSCPGAVQVPVHPAPKGSRCGNGQSEISCASGMKKGQATNPRGVGKSQTPIVMQGNLLATHADPAYSCIMALEKEETRRMPDESRVTALKRDPRSQSRRCFCALRPWAGILKRRRDGCRPCPV